MARPAERVPLRISAARNSRWRLPAGLGAGLLLPFAFAPFGWFWLAPVCLAVLFWLWRGATPRQAAAIGFAFGAGSFLFGTYWIYISVGVFGQAPLVLALGLTIGLAAAMAAYSALAGWAVARWPGAGTGPAALLAMPAFWVLFEWLRGWFLTGFGWLALGYSQTDSWLMGLAPLFGVHGVSLAVAVLGGVIVMLATGSGRERIAAAIAAVTLIGGALRVADYEWTRPRSRVLTAALVQGAVPQDKKWLESQLPATMELYRTLTSGAAGADLVVWPEAAIPQLYENVRAYLARIEQQTRATGGELMLGMLRYHAATGSAQNAVFALGHPGLVYVKRHLVPYGEYFPVPGFVRRWLRALDLPNIDTVPGEEGQPPFPLLGEHIAITICYEDVFGSEQLDSFPAATVLVNVSNDAWFGESFAADQHLQIARMRAAEVGRYLLRTTNTGITAVVDPHGAVAGRLPQFEPGVLRAEFSGYEGSTPFIRWGNGAVVAICVLLLALQAAITKLTMRPGT